jgi:hypothetical protein
MRATYEVGEHVLFQREPGRAWENGEYMRIDDPGWHWVRDDTGFRVPHYVPSRRVKRIDAGKDEAK